MRSRAASLLALTALAGALLTGCGDDGKIAVSKGGPTKETGGSGAGRSDVDPKVCDAIEGTELPDDLASMLPSTYGQAITVVQQFETTMSGEGDQLAPGAVKKLADALSVDGAGDDLVALSAELETACGKGDGTEAFRYLGEASSMVAVKRIDGYCTLLEASFQAGGETEKSLLAGIESQAPPEHREAIRAISGLGKDGQPADEQAVSALGSAFFGIGLYAEGRCGIEGAFAEMLLGAAFATTDDGSSSEGSGDTDGTGGETGTEPATADVGPATEAAAGTAHGVTFEAVRVDLEEDGKYLASVVAPSGWEQNRSFNLTFDPPSGSTFSIFSSLEVSAGCDGMCSATDWEARLRGPEGWLTASLDGWTVADEHAPTGSEGTVVTATKDDGSVRVVVARWDDDADRYFQCVADLDPDDATLAPAFLAACEASRPGWIPIS